MTNESITSISEDSEESEIEREKWRQRSNTWDLAQRSKQRGETDQRKQKSEVHSRGSSRNGSRHGRRTSSRNKVGLGFQLDDDDPPPDVPIKKEARVPEDRGRSSQSRSNHAAHQRDHPSQAGPSSHGESEFRESLRRREALMGLVNGMQLDAGPKSHRTSTGYSDNAYGADAQGLAISGSGDFPNEREETVGHRGRDDRERYERDRRSSRDNSERQRDKAFKGEYRDSSRDRGDFHIVESNQRSRRSSSVPSAARISRIDSPLLLRPRTEKSVHFQPEERPTDEVRASKERKSRHRASTSVDTPMDARRISRGTELQERTSNGDRELNRPRDTLPLGRIQKKGSPLREREAFGIPRSLSYGANDTDGLASLAQDESFSSVSVYDHQGDHAGSICLPHTDSDLSSVDGGSWQPRTDGNGLSTGAQSLFRSLSTSTNNDDEPSRWQQRRRSQTGKPTFDKHDFSVNAHQQRKVEQRGPPITESSSAPSIYEEDPFDHSHNLESSRQTAGEGLQNLRSVMHPATYDALLAKHGPMEMRRQDTIFELSSSEATFVRRLRVTVRRFILPLRQKDSKAWIPGVPMPISRLFDWLEDIVNLHVGLGEVLVTSGDSWKAGDIVFKVAEAVRTFVPRFEVYQPYLMRVDRVTEMLGQAVVNAADEFGEYVRLREQGAGRDEWTLVELLQEPVNRLASYPAIFQKLLECTPRDHSDYLPSLSLLHSARMIMLVMYEVRAREQEYDHVKDISAEIAGLPPSTQLAQRERRLLWEGVMSTSIESSHKDLMSAHRTPRHRRHGAPDTHVDSSELTPVRVLVFTDILLLAIPERRRKKSSHSHGKDRWRVLEKAGVARILSIEERASSNEDPVVSLDLLPLATDTLQTGVIPETTSSHAFQLIMPASLNADERNKALSALRRCHAYAMRSLSFPSHSGKYLSHGLQVDLEQDTQQSVMSILSTGLPLPKSPSVQLTELQRGQAHDSIEQEREERGWWSLRFQQVLREMQRQNIGQAVEPTLWA
ncbi:unnamed protein product [Somion occarium]|uniref:DH domain-containing protein n=1 Tax=Somion occarium TaxID=3059160 RepID=A0ABP1D6D6_9APHY